MKELREKSGAGMMDCKKALAECGGDLDAAADYLRKKGLASAGKKAGRVASEGAVGAYIHAGSRCAGGLSLQLSFAHHDASQAKVGSKGRLAGPVQDMSRL